MSENIPQINVEQSDECSCKETSVIKEGYMVKKGHVRHNWKSRWFTLYPDKLCYHKTKRDSQPKGTIRLKGSSVISPDPEYTKKECVFRLIEIYGTEYLLQCSDNSERHEWVTAIIGAIRSINTLGVSKSNSLRYSDRPTLRSPAPSPEISLKKDGSTEMLVILQNRVTHEDLLAAMQDKEAGIQLKTQKIGDEFFKLCFSGEELITWLMAWAFVKSRKEGRVVAGNLLEKAYLHPISKQNDTLQMTNARKSFNDNSNRFYRFSAIVNNASEIDFDNSDSSNDSEEESIIDDLQGIIVKQGFLVKKGQVRHNWKVRKFILYDEPIRLSYYCPTKDEKINKGKIYLFGSHVRVIMTDGKEADMCWSGKGNKRVVREHCFAIRTKKGKEHILQAPSEEEMNDWVKLINEFILKIENYDTMCSDDEFYSTLSGTSI